MLTCKVCQQSGDFQQFRVREMMFGTREEFVYYQCSFCKCLQILNIPGNLDDYYPQDEYRAFKAHKKITQNFLIQQAKKIISIMYLKSKMNFLGRRLSKRLAYDFIQILSFANLRLSSKILDVGTGTGGRLISLAKKGFSDLSGTDIFIEHDYYYPNGIKIFKKDISEMDDIFDFIMLNHVFEHMPDPLIKLKTIHKLLKPSKFLLIRIPVVDSYAWEKYKENWVQIDAPRHLFLHTRESIRLLAKNSGFEVFKMVDDSKPSQFYGSEQYKMNIPMNSENSYYKNPKKSMFDRNQIKKFQKKTRELNKAGKGDAVCFFLKKI